MNWLIDFHDAFLPEFRALPSEVQRELFAYVDLLEIYGPHLKRPHADTLNGSKYSNMKELRFKAADGVWRFAYAFDQERQGLILVGGNKSGGSEKRFYKSLLQQADQRFTAYLTQRKKESSS